MKKVIGMVLLALAFVLPARAWNCSDPLAERVAVPAGTSGTYGDGDGQLFMGVPGQGTPGVLYQCKVVNPAPPKGGIGSANNSTSTSSSTSQSGATSNSGSTSSATGGQSSSTATGGNSSATGGNATGGNSVSGISNSGNSSNTNHNTANGGAGGAGGQGGSASQTQSSTSSATNNGNGSNNTSTITNVAAPKIPVAPAYAPPATSTSTCFKGMSGGAQAMPFGFSFGGGKIDPNCAILEAARQAPSDLARCKVYVSNKYVKAAGVTLEDCMALNLTVVQGPAVVTPEPPPVVSPVTINLPAPVVTVVQVTPPVTAVAVTPLPTNPALKKKSYKRVSPGCPKPTVWNEDMVESLKDHNKG